MMSRRSRWETPSSAFPLPNRYPEILNGWAEICLLFPRGWTFVLPGMKYGKGAGKSVAVYDRRGMESAELSCQLWIARSLPILSL